MCGTIYSIFRIQDVAYDVVESEANILLHGKPSAYSMNSISAQNGLQKPRSVMPINKEMKMQADLDIAVFYLL